MSRGSRQCGDDRHTPGGGEGQRSPSHSQRRTQRWPRRQSSDSGNCDGARSPARQCPAVVERGMIGCGHVDQGCHGNAYSPAERDINPNGRRTGTTCGNQGDERERWGKYPAKCAGPRHEVGQIRAGIHRRSHADDWKSADKRLRDEAWSSAGRGSHGEHCDSRRQNAAHKQRVRRWDAYRQRAAHENGACQAESERQQADQPTRQGRHVLRSHRPPLRTTG